VLKVAIATKATQMPHVGNSAFIAIHP